MPQMAPLFWLILFFVFLASLLCFSIMNYFMITQEKPFTLSSQILIKQNSWKW
uniref:ATP synthase complex subunit 8 n=1 Tax=Scyllarides latus TaxID=204053 RepID=L0E906_SCYLT|nr:ATP synthase F0 subunit 8 [Scyllarides latus]AGA56118.1 ATP synthase F0 subunit 8 [Scyllarides latus]